MLGIAAAGEDARGITLGEVRSGKPLVNKEAWLGLANGAVTGLLCGVAMYFLALSQASPHALILTRRCGCTGRGDVT